MIVRAATAADVPAIARLEAALFGPDAWSEPQVRDEIGSERRGALVAVEGDHLVGYATTVTADGTADLNRIAVTADRQRQGVARLLLEEVLAAARGRGDGRMLLEVSAANEAALAFYRGAGFAEIDRRRRYYRDGSDAVVMQLLLTTRQEDTVHG